ncbi:MAG: Ig-like domain-containing protein [Cyanobacteria bacterium P01_E01_bin.34]
MAPVTVSLANRYLASVFVWLSPAISIGHAVIVLGLAQFALPIAANAQRISSPSPGINAEDVEPSSSISATFDRDGDVVIRPRTVQIFLDGVDITSESTISGRYFNYTPSSNLRPGGHSVRLQFKNSAGEERQAQWSFSVGEVAAATIESVTHNGSNDPLAQGDNLLVTVTGTPNSDVEVFLVRDGDTVTSLDTEEVSSGVYVASLQVSNAELTDEGIVVARLEHNDLIRFATAEQPLELIANGGDAVEVVTLSGTDKTETNSASDMLRLQVTSHQNGDRVSGSSFELVGRTAPDATIDVVGIASNSLGGFISTQRELVSRRVQADSSGNFRVTVSAGIPVIPDSVYSIELTSSVNGSVSPTTRLQLTQE